MALKEVDENIYERNEIIMMMMLINMFKGLQDNRKVIRVMN